MGVETKEIQVENTESDKDIQRVLKALDSEYSVVKTPITRLGLYQMLADLGYSFAEILIGVMQNLKEIHYSNNAMMRLCAHLGFRRT